MVTLYKFKSEVSGLGDFGEKLNGMRYNAKVDRIIQAYKISLGGE